MTDWLERLAQRWCFMVHQKRWRRLMPNLAPPDWECLECQRTWRARPWWQHGGQLNRSHGDAIEYFPDNY